MDTLLANMRWLCDDARMLSSIAVAYGTRTDSESARYGLAQQVTLKDGRFLPCRRELREDSICDLASLTKLFTSVCTLILCEQGKLSLDECVGDIDSRFIHLKNTTVFDVLSFRVCLRTPGRLDDAPDRETALARLFAVEIAPLPAVRIYSDINAMVIKYVIEARSGLPFAQAVEKLILSPAGMHSTFARVPEALLDRCVCYNYEHRIAGETYILRTDTPAGAPHDPKALILSRGGEDLCGHAGLFSTLSDMTRFAQALLGGELLPREQVLAIGRDRTGRDNGDGTYRQFLGFLCFSKHPLQRLSEVPQWMGSQSIGLSGFTGNHLSIDAQKERFVLFLGNRCHGKVASIVPPEGGALTDYGLAPDGSGLVPWPDGRLVPSSAKYVYFKDARLHEPIRERMQRLGWLQAGQ